MLASHKITCDAHNESLEYSQKFGNRRMVPRTFNSSSNKGTGAMFAERNIMTGNSDKYTDSFRISNNYHGILLNRKMPQRELFISSKPIGMVPDDVALEYFEDEKIWKILADCQVSLALAGLLKLVPRFTEKVGTIIPQNGAETLSVNYSNPIMGPTVINEHSPSIKVMIRGQKVTCSIVDGGSGVNVINKRTCDRLGIAKWDACPFWLRMADTSMVRPLGPICQLDFIVGGHTFQIPIVLLHVDAPNAYPLQLG